MVIIRQINRVFWIYLLIAVLCFPAYAKTNPHRNPMKDYSFKIPRGLEPNVKFWKDIYSKYTTRQSVIHDARDLSVVYEVVDLDPNASRRRNQRRINAVIAKYKKALRNLSRKQKNSRLTQFEKRVKKIAKGSYYRASRNLRAQKGQKDRFRDGLIRSGMYEARINQIFEEFGLPQALTVLPHVESSFQIGAYSSAGAAGIWQFTRGTGRLFMKVGYEVDERRDPILATYAAAKLLKLNYETLRSWPLAVTAYNHGLEGMKRAKRRHGSDLGKIVKSYKNRTFGFASRNFYSEFLAALEVAHNYKKYFPGLKKAPPQRLVSFKFKDYIDVRTANNYFKMTPDEIAEYNPALRPPVLSGSKRIPKGFIFKAPENKVKNLAAYYRQIPKKHKHGRQIRSKWYTVRRGDNLSKIASRFRTSVWKLKRLNNIGRSNRIYKGQVLRLPDPYNSSKSIRVAKASNKVKRTVTKKPQTPKETVSYKVRKYDSLSRVAKRFNTSPMMLTRINNLRDPDSLFPGQVLKIPKSVIVSQAVEASKKVAPVKRNTAIKNFDIKVEKGNQKKAPEVDFSDVKIKIADINGTPPRKLNKNRPAFLPVSFVSSEKTRSPVGIITVDFDETLSHFADWAGLSILELRRFNNLSRKATLHVNQKIKVPFRRRTPAVFEERRQEYHRAIQEDFFSNYRVQKVIVKNVRKGETVWEICNEMYFIPFWLLGNYNPGKDINELKPNDSIIIPMVTPIKTEAA